VTGNNLVLHKAMNREASFCTNSQISGSPKRSYCVSGIQGLHVWAAAHQWQINIVMANYF